MLGALFIVLGALGVVLFAFLSWRSLGGSTSQPDAVAVAKGAPPLYRWAGRACALVFVYGVFRFFTS